MPRKYVPLSRTSILGENPTLFSSSSVALWIVSYSTEAFGYRDLTTASGIESAGFPGQREEEIERLLHMVRTVSESYVQLLIRQGCRWRWPNRD